MHGKLTLLFFYKHVSKSTCTICQLHSIAFFAQVIDTESGMQCCCKSVCYGLLELVAHDCPCKAIGVYIVQQHTFSCD